MKANDINWKSFKQHLECSIRNEHIWAIGSNGEEYNMHLDNIERMKEQIKDIENGDYRFILDYYDESVFDEFLM